VGAETGTARLFVGLMLPDGLAAALEQAVAGVLAPAGRGLRRVRASELHLSLAFLGDVERERVEQLGQALERALAASPAPALELVRGGTFPERGRPRVWWIGLAERAGTEGRLAALAARVAGAVGRERGAREPFRAHLTVARTRGRGAPPEVESAFRALRPAGGWRPRSAALVESRLDRPEARYRTLRELPLAPDPCGAEG